ncbi:SPOR domain-containing protein [Janthinobacterium sp.]|uniref:SPOR domain-containing protein n=1 Tax=Janthinobacterium sp. TaxID=1871054 RepID=UPI00293D1DCF|nr:SPOR domain-containing protein [Janthinobacterium sp.]
MGLFSIFRKNKQDGASVDSGFYNADDQAAGAKARSKRASNAGAGAAPRRAAKEAADPVLPEKKRARRRLMGAIALALGVAVGLPMLLDSEPKPLASDIAFQIPSKDKPAAAHAAPAAAPSSSVAASAALDQSEEIVTAAEARPKPAAPIAPVPAAAPQVAEVRTYTEPKPEAPAKVAAKPDTKSDELKAHEAKLAEARAREAKLAEAKVREAREAREAKLLEAKAAHEAKLAEAKAAHEAKPVEAKPAAKPAQSADDATRALSILEGKAAAKPAEAAAGRFVVQVAALATQDKVDELQEKLRDAGIHSFTQKVPTPAGERIRVRVGPFGSREDAEKARAKLNKLGLGGSLVPV